MIETSSYHPDPVESTFADRPYIWFGCLDYESDFPGNDVTYWSVTSRALCDMLIYAGFAWVEPMDTFPMKRGTTDSAGTWQYTSAIAHVNPNPALVGYRKVKARPAPNELENRLDPPQSQPSPMGLPMLLRRFFSSIKPHVQKGAGGEMYKRVRSRND